MNNKRYIFVITYNDSSDYVVSEMFDEYKEALKEMNFIIQKEIEYVKNAFNYEPSILEYTEDDITLVYAECYTLKDPKEDVATESCAYYRLIGIDDGWIQCAKREPAKNEKVLVTTITGEVVIEYIDANVKYNSNRIIAWMPLPKPFGYQA